MTYIPAVGSRSPVARGSRKSVSWSISEYLAAYGLVLIAPALILFAVLLHRYITSEQAQLEQQALQAVRSLRGDIDQALMGFVTSLEALATSPAITARDLPGFYKHAAAIAHGHAEQSIALIEPSGHEVVNTRVPWGDPLPMTANIEMLRKVLETRKSYISDLFVGAVGQEPHFTVVVPVIRDGEVVYLLSLALKPDHIARFLQPPRLPVGWEGAVADRQGRIIALSHDQENNVGQSLPRRILAERQREPEGVSYVSDTEGREGLKAFTRSGAAGWFISAGIRSDFAAAPVLSWRFFALAGGALLAFSFVLALYFGRRVARPIRLTALAASALGRGEAMPQLPLKLREVDEVLKALKDASAERHLAEEQLRIAHERMTLALSATEMGMWERDLATNSVIWSDAMYSIFGRSPDEFGGRPDEVLSFVHAEDQAGFRATYQKAIVGQAPTFEHEARIVRPDGEVRWIYRRAFIRRDETGRARSVLGVALDITERKQAEFLNAQLAAIVASSSEAILSVSPDGIIATWNAGAEQTFGYDGEEVVGKSLQQLFAPSRMKDFEAVAAAMRAGQTIRLESECQAADGRAIEVQIVANPVRAANAPGAAAQAISRHSVLIRDISERKEHDRHLATVMRELTHRSKNLLAVIQAMARQTAIRSSSLSDFETRFSGRLQSLARSHELLISNDWEGAALDELVDMQRSTFGPRQLRIYSSGPKVFLRPEAILNIGLALHELASNAERHGALSVPEGGVDLTWTIVPPNGRGGSLHVVWRERGGVASEGGLPQRGFGRDIIEHVAPTALGAKVELKHGPGGLEWSLLVPPDQFARASRDAA